MRHQSFAGEDETLGGAGELDVGDRRPAEPAVAEAIRLVDVDCGDVRVERARAERLREILTKLKTLTGRELCSSLMDAITKK